MYRFPSKVDDLHFPVFAGDPLPSPILSMDEYAAWVDFNDRYVTTPEARKEALKRMPVQVPFRLVD